MNVHTLGLRKEFGKTVAADVAHRFREEIITCRLKPGESLKFEDLRSRFGVSFSTLREALMTLVSDGFVINEQQRGFHVAPATLEELVDITEARVLVEKEALRKAIERGNDDWEIRLISALHQLNRIEERTKGKLSHDVEWRRAHREFHQALVSGCASPTLISFQSVLFDRSERFRSLSASYRPNPRNKSGEHKALMKAAIARDADEATMLIERHIRATTENVKKYALKALTGVAEK
ncbi:GntR family transcriptional regulator [Bradyrhizobium macuxiense]|uniref:GntR family transcriptional regulator n=1 Tax=Bradyrhizobium macuxiense TaxID=1755647 RepID=A0A560KX65_9BRAD|nr:GntR family transcriptional regulator [Bradyrhizobium macuxiense]TWB87782.1 GntR family transcriptional regulator [Bradyrhizobium macuxiense]